MHTILVWDWPVRIGHWLLAGGFILAWATSESETWRLVHAYAGGAMMGVALFRGVWGLAGTRHALFSSFVRGPTAAWGYVKQLLSDQPPHSTGHNPAGGLAIVLLLVLTVLTGLSGWLVYQELGGDFMEELHEGLSGTMMALVVVHLAGVGVGSLAHKENLVRPMLTGRKLGATSEAIANARPLAAMVLLVWAALCAWWFGR